ncbi:hypothetical protein [Acidithiobacillus ferriphilus]|uniref:hypothetical protein n=1 Tax=Acidithiobacillus ferriphilus TaxID=1689834 RepID=UPI00398B94C8
MTVDPRGRIGLTTTDFWNPWDISLRQKLRHNITRNSPVRPVFIDWIAANPLVGDVIPGADGARKVRWSRAGSGKSSGARVIYFNLTEQEVVLLVAAYAKAERANMLPAEIKKVV